MTPQRNPSPQEQAVDRASSVRSVQPLPDATDRARGEANILNSLLPSWLPEPIRSRITHRRLAMLVFGVTLAVSFAAGRAEEFIEAAVMVGIPLFIILRVARSRIRQSNISASSLRDAPRSAIVLTAGRLLARGLPKFGGGFYGMVATTTFIAYQVRELGSADWLQPDAWNGAATRASADPFGFFKHDVAMMLWDALLPISANWIQGLIHAAIWPVYVLEWGGFWSLAAVIVVGFAYTRLMPRLWPVVLARVATRNARIRPMSPSQTGTPPDAPQGPSFTPHDDGSSE